MPPVNDATADTSGLLAIVLAVRSAAILRRSHTLASYTDMHRTVLQDPGSAHGSRRPSSPSPAGSLEVEKEPSA